MSEENNVNTVNPNGVQEDNGINISNDVVAVIAGMAASNVPAMFVYTNSLLYTLLFLNLGLAITFILLIFEFVSVIFKSAHTFLNVKVELLENAVIKCKTVS